ncbi:P2X purinoceptor 7-like [Xenia sp. Carnegie-2017]|uniref:P2X purinoceptor 7-like n=1 Tax=Xenia sp. Carnegie-2017 TaxID=2897299 RepID=UPI001F045385|nr:P2X purinoceptor 7-like [Xenia sp. Carnegie-2017]
MAFFEEPRPNSPIDSEMEDNPTNNIRPYQFEPEWPADEHEEAHQFEDNEEQEFLYIDDESRRDNLEWCQCGNCQIMDNNEECLCCKEISNICDKNLEAVETNETTEVPLCITQHPGFEPVCLNRWVLQTAWYQYKQQYEVAYDGPEDKLYRHIAYRQLARWCWGVLGREVRVILPSCAVTRIRETFPPPGLAEEFQFEGFHYVDE